MTQACPCPQTQQCKLRQRCLDIACINNVQDLNKLKLIPTLIQFGYQKWYQLTSSITSTPTNQSLVHSTQWVAYIGPSSLLVCTLFSLIHGGAPLNFVGKAFKAVFCAAHQDDIKYVDNKVDYIYGAWTTSQSTQWNCKKGIFTSGTLPELQPDQHPLSLRFLLIQIYHFHILTCHVLNCQRIVGCRRIVIC